MSKKALVLGTGLVSRPCVEMLLKQDFLTTCVSINQEELDNFLKAFPALVTVNLDVSKVEGNLRNLIKESNIVICLLPNFLQSDIALICIEEGKNLITTSYVDDATKRLHNRAVAAGITILAEAGLDPGIDHMITMNCVDALKEAGGQITELRSICGGIPANESTAGSMKYKFSWYPKGVFISALQPARVDAFSMDRDSLKYRDVYDIQTVSSLFRGTLRYQGFSKVLKSLELLGLMDQSALPELALDAGDLTWRELMAHLLGLSPLSTKEDVEKAVLEKLECDPQQLKTITELKLTSDENVPRKTSTLDSLCSHLAGLLAYEPGEEDLVLMWIRVAAKLPNGQLCSYEVSLSEKGTPIGGQSAMSKTVGVTAALCADLLAAGGVQTKGVILTTTKDIYEPVLAKLSEEGITIKTTVKES